MFCRNEIPEQGIKIFMKKTEFKTDIVQRFGKTKCLTPKIIALMQFSLISCSGMLACRKKESIESTV
jgi:hypothetical protein